MPKNTILFSPGKIGKLTIRNRIIMPAMQTRGADNDGFVTNRLIDYYAERAKGGAGLIVVQQSFAWPEAKLRRGIALWDDKYISRLSDLAGAVKNYGARVAIQLGSRGTLQEYEGLDSVAPSAEPFSWMGKPPRELTREDIEFYINAFVEAACRVKKAGFDAVELHCAHGHLLSMFLSPHSNYRSDEYGGSVENRTRFARSIIEQIKVVLGKDFPILVRMNGSDFIEGGIEINEAVEQARLFVESGADALSISGSCHETIYHHIPSYLFPPGNLVHLAHPIKKVVNVPVVTVSKINQPEFAEQILAEGKADFVAIGRPLIADPHFPIKAREGRHDDIRHCLYCCNCLTWDQRPRLQNRGFSCTVNPAVLREKEFTLIHTARPKKVMVIGGGIAGMEAARTLAERGHVVSLYERNKTLGGQWSIAAAPEHKNDYKTLIPFLERGMEKAGVNIYLNIEVTRKVIEEKKPDIIIIASGAVPGYLNVPDLKKGPNILLANDVLKNDAEVGDRVVVVGGRYLGMEAAVILAQQGKHVSLVETFELGHNTHPLIKVILRNRLVERGVYIYPRSTVIRIASKGVDVANNGSILHLKADSMVLAVGTQSNNSIITELSDMNIEVYAIGDCNQVRDAMEAINDGAEIARSV